MTDPDTISRLFNCSACGRHFVVHSTAPVTNTVYTACPSCAQPVDGWIPLTAVALPGQVPGRNPKKRAGQQRPGGKR